jgi:hypothetical protein
VRRRSYTAARLTSIPAPAPAAAQPVSPLGQALQTMCEAIVRHEIEPCPVCGRFDCDHDEWAELMYTDPTTTELIH